jgi:hypothetical protein
VEDEDESIANEYQPRKPQDNDVPCRGIIDQEPMMVQLVSLDTRFVLVSDPKAALPSKREALKVKKTRNREGRSEKITPTLNIETSEPIPILERRKPSPYSFTRTPTGGRTNADYFLSPETTVPHTSTGIPRSMPNEDGFKSMKSHSRKDSSMTSESTANRSDSSDDSEPDRLTALKNRSMHGSRSARTSSTDLPGMNARHQSIGGRYKRPDSSKDFMDSSNSGNLQADYFGDTDGIQKAPNRNTSSSSKPVLGKLGLDETHYWETRHSSIASPVVASGMRTPKPGKSPRTDSRPESPLSPWEPFHFEHPKVSQDRFPEYNLPLHQKPKPSSRLNSVNRAYDGESSEVPRVDVKGTSPDQKSDLPYPDIDQKRGGSSLPYPDEDHPMAMPNQYHFMVTPKATDQPAAPPSSSSINYSDAPKTSRPRDTRKPTDYDSQTGPSINRTTSLRSDISHDSQKTPSLDRSTSLISESDSFKKSVPSSPTIPSLPPCPRRKFTKKYNDWYALKGCKNFDVCPSCYKDIIRPSQFRTHFYAGQPHSSNASVRCDFGSMWIRLAWLLMIKQHRTDVDLIHALAKVSDDERPCPENNQSVGTWYGLLDRRGIFVENFFICPRDKTSLEVLFPGLKGALCRVPSSRIPALCALRGDSRRFPSYIDVFDAIHDSALKQYRKSYSSSRNPPPLSDFVDMGPAINLAAELSKQAECPRDSVTPNFLWHFISDMPDLTVCPECYDDVIAPDAERSLPLALAFTPAPRPVPSSAIATSLSPGAVHGMPNAFTCCLYSERMRDAWDNAVLSKNGDGGVMKWVALARERRIRECDLAAKKADLLKMAGSVRAELFGGPGDSQWIKKELQKVEDEWELWE